MRIHLIRHTAVGVPAGTCYGRSDVPLAAGWQQAVAEVRAGVERKLGVAGAVWSSPLSRCLHLAHELAGGDAPRADARLREMDFGHWEMRPWQAIGRGSVDAWLADLEHHVVDGGESLGAVAARSGAFLEELAGSGGESALVVTHGGVIRCLVAIAIGLPLARADRVHVDYGSLSTLSIGSGGRRLEALNLPLAE